jgi:hypothetical protein
MLVISCLLSFCLGKLVHHFRQADTAHIQGVAVTFASLECHTLGLIAMGWLGIAYIVVFIR